MLLRFLFFLLLVYLGFKIYFALRAPRSKRAAKKEPLGGEEMVLDPQCRSYLPKSEALLRGEHYFCSEDCARLYLAERRP